MNRIFGIIFAVGTLSATALALRCYQCENCNTVKSTDLVTCGANDTAPPSNNTDNNSTGNSLYFQDLFFNYNDDADRAVRYECGSLQIKNAAGTTIVRGCIEMGDTPVFCLRTDDNATERHIHTCLQDGCNAGVTASFGTAVAGVAVLSWLVLH